MIGIFVLIALLLIFGTWRIYRRKSGYSDLTSWIPAFGRRALFLAVWIICIAIFIAVMYPMLRLKFWLTFLGSVALIWVGWDQEEQTITTENDGSFSGWKTFKKPLRTFGFIGLAISSAAIVLVRYFIYIEGNKSGAYVSIAALMIFGLWLLHRRKERKFNRLNDQSIDESRNRSDKFKTHALDILLLWTGWIILIISTYFLILLI